MKKINFNYIKIIFSIFFGSVLVFYGYYSIPYWYQEIAWKDIYVEGLRFVDNEDEYGIAGGFLYKNGQSRKMKFELSPTKLLENEKILRLAMFSQITKEDPLFTAPGLESERYVYAVEKLDLVHADLLKSLKLTRDVLPINYLKSSAKTVSVNQTFSQDTNEQTAHELLNSYQKTNEDYSADSKQLIENLNQSAIGDALLVQAGSKTTLKIMIEDLNKTIQNSSTIGRIITDRRACLDRSIIYCKRATDSEGGVLLPENLETNSPDFLSGSKLYFTKDPEDLVAQGPYQIETSCWGKDGKATDNFYMYLFEENTTEFHRIIPKLATTNYYKEISYPTKDLISLDYLKKGLKHRVVLETTPYNCNNLGYQADLATMNLFLKKYPAGIFGTIEKEEYYQSLPQNLKDLVAVGKEYETKFYGTPNPSGDLAKNIENIYKSYYSNLVKSSDAYTEEVDKAYITHKENILARGLLLERKLGDYDALLNFHSYVLEGFSKTTKWQDGQSYDYVYTSRNDYSFILMPFSKSVWRIPTKLQFVETDMKQLDSSLISHDQLLKKYGEEYVSKINKITRNEIWRDITGETIK